MADHIPVQLKHLYFKAQPEELNFAGSGRGEFPIFQRTDRAQHANYLKTQLADVGKKFEDVLEQRQSTRLSSEFGLIINVCSEPGYPLKFESLEQAPTKTQEGISLLNLRHEETPSGTITKAAIFVPHGQLKVLEKKVQAYANPQKDSTDRQGESTGPRNERLLNNIHSIAVAALDALWTDPDPLPASEEIVWFECWIRRDQQDWQKQFLAECERLEILASNQTLVFPDHIVVIAHATLDQLESSLDLLNCLSEIRLARPCSVGLTDLSGVEQEEWLDEALERIKWPTNDAPAVCLLDTGVNRGHPLIEPLLNIVDMATVFGEDDKSDDTTFKHGTPMAGLAAYGDLRNLMLSSGTWQQLHRVESVKLIRSTSSHDPENYGAVTLAAINEPESIAPRRPRVFCMAVTAPGPNTHGIPSAWSTALDIAASGAQAEDDQPRIILVSVGNTHPENEDSFNYPETNRTNPVEDPAQAWNVISVGAVTNHTNIREASDEAHQTNAIAPTDGVSPFTRTSHPWPQPDRLDWPVAPDVVMEGGNLGRDQSGDLLHFDSLQPLSTASDFRLRPVTPFNATSAATALASRVAARITEKYSNLHAETIRGLLVHSARWPQKAIDQANFDPFSAGTTQKVKDLMRSYGYGVVDEERALNSLNNQTTFLIENELQPYEGDAGSAKLNQCHMIQLPWPETLLENSPDTTFTLRVTLSYFIQPNPGSRTWEKSQKYKYASHMLGFKPKHSGQSLDEFRSRLDADEESQGETLNDSGWAVGAQARGKCGSLVQDVWKGSATDLASMDAIAVFPRARGWWATRKYLSGREEHNCHLNTVQYALIISLETESDLPVYTDVRSAIARIEAQTAIDLPSE